MVYIYEMSFDNVKNWLPQTTEKMLKYLESLTKNAKKDIDFDLEKTQWKIYLKPKNEKAGMQLNKVVKKEQTSLDNLDKFKKVLELSHLVEIQLKAFFEKLSYTSKNISYASFKNQHEYLIQKEKHKALSDRAKKLFSAPEIVKEQKDLLKDVLDPLPEFVLNQGMIRNVVAFEFSVEKSVFLLGFNNIEDQDDEIYTLYALDSFNKNISVKYFFDKALAKEIYKIKDLMEHNVLGKKIKRVSVSKEWEGFNFRK